ncbi:MAG: hypothetical protein QOF60_1416 [Actinomycetota bacterium]|jgi:hypothetical protein|nr:hypothetical protein [Actinomycetota bacterium]
MAEQARKPGTAPPLTEELAARATIIAMGVRNAMEATVHGGELDELSLSDEQMATLNPIIRNAIATALHAEKHYVMDRAARAYLDFQAQLVPSYWEPAQLLQDYTDLWPFYAAQDLAPESACRRCGRTIVNLGLDGDNRWTHVAADGGLNVGCRAASFERGAGWNDALPRTWKAAPTRKGGT